MVEERRRGAGARRAAGGVACAGAGAPQIARERCCDSSGAGAGASTSEACRRARARESEDCRACEGAIPGVQETGHVTAIYVLATTTVPFTGRDTMIMSYFGRDTQG